MEMTINRLSTLFENEPSETELGQALREVFRSHQIGMNGHYTLEGFIGLATAVRRAVAQVEPDFDPTLPPQMFDPNYWATMFGLNIDDFAPSRPHDGANGSANLSSERLLQALEEIAESHQRIANHFDPPPPDKVGTEYVADKLGCSKEWVTQMIRRREIPRGCVVPGTGNGKTWKLYRNRVDDWLASR